MNEKQVAWESLVKSIKNFTTKYGSICVSDKLADTEMFVSEKDDFTAFGSIEL